ncbi:hypothetical protein [Okeania sp. SIO2B3]|uniref:hypothetical protein n=1 Tax=Okeania sp. SIO2B3 TaxID=2607784 RepID=UPI0013BF4D71|nr:hypothetical protein [Okeania sp. SIO2B3]NET46633.1 hypothetical protein [Okeania sp. SIO2B3]
MNKIIVPPDGAGNYEHKTKVPGFWETLSQWFWHHLPTVFKVWEKHELVDPNLDENYAQTELKNYANLEDIKYYADTEDIKEYFNN